MITIAGLQFRSRLGPFHQPYLDGAHNHFKM
jgi:hypothetical protein